jgi:N-acetylglucosaminyldiphosphoundecaprenol N-acetyl-beta-D-mannosaminyltransferase
MNAHKAFTTINVGGLRVSVSNLDEAAAWICSDEALSQHRAVHLGNAYTVSLLGRVPNYQETLDAATAIFPDGKPVAWFARRFGATDCSQVRGPDLFRAVLKASEGTSVTHFLLGGSEETMEKLRTQIRTQFPKATIAGHLCPPFRASTPEERKEQDKLIAASGATFVWVGLGTPAQDFETHRIARELPVTAIAIGAAFDFLAETKAEAPRWIQRIGAEWVFRLASEPRRLWKRYFVGNMVFLSRALKNSPQSQRRPL